MKTTPALSILLVALPVLCGCTDASVAKRDDGRYVTLPANAVPVAPATGKSPSVLPGETGRKLAPDNAYATTVVNEDGPAQQKQREAQNKLEDDLAKLDSK